jgi:predicted nucleotidyltransferase
VATEARRDDNSARGAMDVAAQVAEIVRTILARHEYRLFLFGSWAHGDAHRASDIDICIDGPAPVDAVTMRRIRDAWDRLSTLHTVDLVDISVLPPSVRGEALRSAVDLGSAA